MNPDSLGNIQFGNISVGALNTTAGTYHYCILWTNGTAAGGLNGSFEIVHSMTYQLIYPKGAQNSLYTENNYGDIVPIQILLNDSDNGALISGGSILYNWTDGFDSLIGVGSGVYETSLDTSSSPFKVFIH